MSPHITITIPGPKTCLPVSQLMTHTQLPMPVFWWKYTDTNIHNSKILESWLSHYGLVFPHRYPNHIKPFNCWWQQGDQWWRIYSQQMHATVNLRQWMKAWWKETRDKQNHIIPALQHCESSTGNEHTDQKMYTILSSWGANPSPYHRHLCPLKWPEAWLIRYPSRRCCLFNPSLLVNYNFCCCSKYSEKPIPVVSCIISCDSSCFYVIVRKGMREDDRSSFHHREGYS